MQYDERVLAERLRVMSAGAKVLFACACAERLMPAYGWFCAQGGKGDFTAVRRILDKAWGGGQGAFVPPSSLHDWRAHLEALVPCVEHQGARYLAAALAQYALAGVAYVLDVWETGDLERARSVALQLYNAADTLIQQAAPPHMYVPNIDAQLPVEFLVNGIYAALDHPLTATDLRSTAEADGERFLKFVTGEVPWNK